MYRFNRPEDLAVPPSPIFFDARANRKIGDIQQIPLRLMWEVMTKCAKVDGADVGAVKVHSVPLGSSQSSTASNRVLGSLFGAYHVYVTIRIGRAYWSFERYEEGILVQRSLEERAVIEKSMKEKRISGNCGIKSESLGKNDDLETVEDLILVLKTAFNALVHSRFDGLLNNCQHFARKILRAMGFNWSKPYVVESELPVWYIY
ncbi:uncharacterized protein LOC108673342 [Hyalella azteca]|uniref:Uncharacterized protein LOC108673342 n=1 Tax=Hyalella azteca TaxID=294128 RepID=A0A8B7NSF1_HYAAZ|nr:uncharacterized protein LOC108673342 [Hyalella azteca]